MDPSPWIVESGDGPLVAVALHDAHAVRAEVAELLALPAADRLREEDPHTGSWTAIAPNRWIALRSRFEVDLNRSRERAVYRKPEDAWGLQVWKRDLPEAVIERSLRQYDACYAELRRMLERVERAFGRFVVFDIHSYNHRREGPDAPPAPAPGNPQVNVGTGTMDRARWAAVVDRFIADLSAVDFPGGPLDVRENIRFRGGHFARWVHEQFPRSGCVLAIEFKKFFMDEWSGAGDPVQIAAIGAALQATVPGVRATLERG